MPPLRFERALVVANPIAGQGRAKACAEALRAGLQALGAEAELFLTTARGDARRRVAEMDPGVDLVVCVGGDGTLGEVFAALPSEVPAAVLPMGTANVMGQDLRIPRDVEGLLALIERGRVQQLDTATVNGQLSFLVVGVGFDGEIVRDVEQRRRGPITKLFYLRSVLRIFLANSRPRLSVTVDGELLPGEWAWVLVSNIVGYGGVLRLSKDRQLDDGEYEVYLFPKGSRLALLGYGLRGLLGRLPGGSCKMMRASRIKIDADRPTPYEIDGDFGGETPVEIEVTRKSQCLLVP